MLDILEVKQKEVLGMALLPWVCMLVLFLPQGTSVYVLSVCQAVVSQWDLRIWKDLWGHIVDPFFGASGKGPACQSFIPPPPILWNLYFSQLYCEHFPVWLKLIEKLINNQGLISQTQGLHPWVVKIPWRRAWQPTPVFLPAESHGQRSLVGYSPWGHRESDTTEATEHAHACSPPLYFVG